MDITAADYLALALAFSVLFDALRQVCQTKHRPTYREIVSVIAGLTIIVIAMCHDVNDHVSEGTFAGYIAVLGASCVAEYVGFMVIDLIIMVRSQLKANRAKDSEVNNRYRWIILSVVGFYIIDVTYYVYLVDNGSRVDLIVALTVGLAMSLFIVEKARQQEMQHDAILGE